MQYHVSVFYIELAMRIHWAVSTDSLWKAKILSLSELLETLSAFTVISPIPDSVSYIYDRNVVQVQYTTSYMSFCVCDAACVRV